MEEYKKKTSSGDDVFIRVQTTTSNAPRGAPPTVVLQGWLGAQHRNVAKYRCIFEAMGYNSVQLIAPPSVIFALSSRTVAVFILSVIRIVASDERLTAGGIVFMNFSNGGAVSAPHLAEMFAGGHRDVIMADDEPAVKTVGDAMAGIIFDSAPCYQHVYLGARALNEGMAVPEGLLQMIVSALFAAMCALRTLIYGDVPRMFWDALREADYRAPELYLYSTADRLTDHEMIDALVEERTAKGKQVRVFRVEDAPHVMLLRKHPGKYVEAIRGVNEWGINVYRERCGLPPWRLPSDVNQ